MGVGVLAVLLHCVVDYPLQQRPALGAFFFAMAVLAAGTDERKTGARTMTYYEELG